MVTVACVLRTGSYYNAEYVAKLQRAVARNLHIEHRFVCLSDVDVPCERIPLIHDYKGWWNKIELFRPGLFDGPVLYIDLDSIIVGDLTKCFDVEHTFTMAHDFNHYKGDAGFACSTAMCWHGDYSFIYETYAEAPKGYQRIYDFEQVRINRVGDQAFIEDCLNFRDVFPDLFRDTVSRYFVASYKVDTKPVHPSIIAFHGAPKPHDLKTPNKLLEHWH